MFLENTISEQTSSPSWQARKGKAETNP
ncbi:hypothetical protein A2U01_0084354, partial [Trifolium medium]|nr:hypothetical protein [Trifolium medium]